MSATDLPTVAVIGGSGFYELIEHGRSVTVDTPFGAPSDVVTIGEIGGRSVAFLPRHGRGHTLAPHLINYRANIWALRSLGVHSVLAPCAVGSLDAGVAPGTFVVPDQVVDVTQGRPRTLFDDRVEHAGYADPYCPGLREAVLKAGAEVGVAVRDGATMVVVQGPRFSSRAESRFFAAQGWTLINMTGEPEATLAREAAICYTPVALVTDVDAGADASEAVHQDDVYAVFADRLPVLRTVIETAVAGVPEQCDQGCRRLRT